MKQIKLPRLRPKKPIVPNLQSLISLEPFTSYHVYIKGARNRQIFRDDTDYVVYLALLRQYVRLQRTMDSLEHLPIVGNSAVKLLAYELQPHTVQLVVSQTTDPDGIARLMRAVYVSYGSYCRKKYRTNSVVFNDMFKATALGTSEKTALVKLIGMQTPLHRRKQSFNTQVGQKNLMLAVDNSV